MCPFCPMILCNMPFEDAYSHVQSHNTLNSSGGGDCGNNCFYCGKQLDMTGFDVNHHLTCSGRSSRVVDLTETSVDSALITNALPTATLSLEKLRAARIAAMEL